MRVIFYRYIGLNLLNEKLDFTDVLKNHEINIKLYLYEIRSSVGYLKLIEKIRQ